MTGVVMLVNKFPPVPAGGAEKQAERLAGFLGAHGVQVGVLTRSAEGLPAYQQRDGFWVRRIAQRGPGELKTVTFTLGCMLALVLRRNDYTVLHTHQASAPAVAAALVGRLLGKKVVVKFANSGQFGEVYVSQRSLKGRIKMALLRWGVDVNIALDSVTEDELVQAGFARERVQRLGNGINTDTFRVSEHKHEAKAALGLAGKTVLLYVGRLVPQKALPDLLTALAQARTHCPQLHLLLVGQGPDQPALEQQAHALGLDDAVSFLGNHAEVQPFLAAADMFVLSSLGEGISNALLEAMASGLACVVTAVGGSPEVLDQGRCGLLVPPQRPDLLAAALVEVASDPAKLAQLGAAARERIVTHYAFSVVGNQYIALYERLQRQVRGPSVKKQLDAEP